MELMFCTHDNDNTLTQDKSTIRNRLSRWKLRKASSIGNKS